MQILKLRIIFICCLLGVFSSNFAGATEKRISDQFHQAQKIFEMALKQSDDLKHINMLKVAHMFLSLIKDNKIENGFLYYNIGNAYYEANQKGKALLYYEKANRLINGNKDILNNLAQVRVDLKLPKPHKTWSDSIKESLFFWHYLMGIQLKQTTFITLFILFWVLLTVSIYVKHLFIRGGIYLIFFVMLGIGGSYFIDYYNIHYVQQGIVTSQTVWSRKGPGDSYTKYYEQYLPEGMKFHVIDTVDEWYKVEMEQGDQLWIPKEKVDLI